MIKFEKLTIIIPSLLSNIDSRWIQQVNRFNQQKNKCHYFCSPKFKKKNKFINKFDKY